MWLWIPLFLDTTLRHWIIGSRRLNDTTFLRNDCNLLSSSTASYSKRMETLNIIYSLIQCTNGRNTLSSHRHSLKTAWRLISSANLCSQIPSLKHFPKPYEFGIHFYTLVIQLFVGLRVISYLLANSVFTYTLRPKRPARIIVLQSICSSSVHLTSKQRMIWFATRTHCVKRLRCVFLNYTGNGKTAAKRPVRSRTGVFCHRVTGNRSSPARRPAL